MFASTRFVRTFLLVLLALALPFGRARERPGTATGMAMRVISLGLVVLLLLALAVTGCSARDDAASDRVDALLADLAKGDTDAATTHVSLGPGHSPVDVEKAKRILETSWLAGAVPGMRWRTEAVIDEPSAFGDGKWVVVRLYADELSGPGYVVGILVYKSEDGWKVDLWGSAFKAVK